MSSQAEWDAYAVAIEGEWQLCANCQPDAAGKKLFRQYNYNRTVTGLGIVLSPINNEEFSDARGISFEFFTTGIPAIKLGRLSGSGVIGETWIVAQMGKIMDNPKCFLPTGSVGQVFAPGSEIYDFFDGLAPGIGGTFTMCQFTVNGAPGLKVEADVAYNG